MAFKMKNTPDKMFHKASGEVQQPQLPGVQEPGGYGKNPEAVSKGLGSMILGGLGAYVGGKIYNKGKQMYADYSAGKKARESKANLPDVSSSGPKKPVSKGGTYESAKKNNPNLDKLIKTRSSSKKGSQAYVDAQNAINKAYGSKKVHSVSKPAAKPTAKPTAKPVAVSGDAKPKGESPKPQAPVKPKSRKEVRVENRANRKNARKARRSARQMKRANKLIAKAGGAKKPEAANAKYND